MTDLKSSIRAFALEAGFDAVGFAPATLDGAARDGLAEFLANGHHGDMGWMAEKSDRRGDPQTLWPAARSVVVVAANYGPASDPLERMAELARHGRGWISAYAQNRDYHDVMKKRLKAVARQIHDTYGSEVKVFVDTAPVMEKPLAARAGIGWQGKHTNVVSRDFGSWLFLGEVYTDLDLAPDAAATDRCGACRRCLDVCPTNAFLEPHKLDARRCISYLTIEHKGHIPRALRAAMGNRIYGCDDCLSVCPWNKFAKATDEPAFLPRLELTAPRLADMAVLDDTGFRTVFAGSAIKRIGRDRFVRNILIAIGNSGDAGLVSVARGLLSDGSPLVRAMAVWALSRLLDARDFRLLRERHLSAETDADVRSEWTDGQAIGRSTAA